MGTGQWWSCCSRRALEPKDNDSRTPLLLAAMRGQEAVVKLLLEKGAKLEFTEMILAIYIITISLTLSYLYI
jgi:Ankyrin repeat